MTYGWITELDGKVLEKTLDLICEDFPSGKINITEIGVHQGNTSRGLRDYLKIKGREINHTGIDNQRDFKMEAPFPGSRFIVGNSIEVYNKIDNNSQQLIFIDGNHSYPMTMADFLVYSDKVIDGGCIAFHDTGKQIKSMTDFQGIGDMDDPDMYIACRKSVKKLGLLDDRFEGWRLIFDEYDENFHTGGIIVVKKEITNSEYYEQYMNIQ